MALMTMGCTIPHAMKPQPRGRTCPDAVSTNAGTEPALTWFVPDRPGDQKTLHAWCTTVGPAEIDSVPEAHFAAWREDDSLAVVTWNVHAGGGHLLEFIERELDLSCAIEPPTSGDRFSHFVLLLQEAFRRSGRVPEVAEQSIIPPRLKEEQRPGRRIDIVEAAQQCGLSLVYVPSMRNGADEYDSKREDRGNAILSTLPLSDFIAIELPFEAQRRVAVAATVRGPNGDSLRLISLHLDTSSSLLRTLGTGNSTRLRQALGLVDALQMVEVARAHAHDSTRLMNCYPKCGPDSEHRFISSVIGGDLNTWSYKQTVIKHLLGHFPESPSWDGKPTRGIFPTDHLFFRRSADSRIELFEDSYRRIDDAYYSDHRARIGWLKMGSTVQPP